MQIKTLREALEYVGYAASGIQEDVMQVTEKALALSHDTSALDALVKDAEPEK